MMHESHTVAKAETIQIQLFIYMCIYVLVYLDGKLLHDVYGFLDFTGTCTYGHGSIMVLCIDVADFRLEVLSHLVHSNQSVSQSVWGN